MSRSRKIHRNPDEPRRAQPYHRKRLKISYLSDELIDE